MRIALVSQEYPPETAKGGIGAQTRAKAIGLAAMGHEIHVISRSPNGIASSRSEEGVHVTRVAGAERRFPVHTEIADWLSYSTAVCEAIAARNEVAPFDLVEFPEWGCEGYVHLLNRTPWNHIPTAIHLHGPLVMFAHALSWPDPDSEFVRTGMRMEETCLRLADAVFSSSACSAGWCAKHYGLDATAIPVWHTGVDTAHFRPMPELRPPAPTVVFAGRLARNKGIHLLVEAMGRLRSAFPGLRLRILGGGGEQAVGELRRLAAGVGAESMLEFSGYVDARQLPQELNRAHVFAAPSVYEGGPGFVYLEAMACGLPVIGCSGSGVAEVVADGQTGILVKPGDAEAVTAALRVLLSNRELGVHLGANARRYTEEHADTRRRIPLLEQLYREIVTRCARSRTEAAS